MQDSKQQHLLGSVVTEVRPLTAGTTYIQLEDGRELIHQSVPRQEQPAWQPGTPWAELAVFDVFTSHCAPLPRLRAADVQAGWLIRDYVPGKPLAHVLTPYDGADEHADGKLFNCLLTGLRTVHSVFAKETEALQPFVVAADDGWLPRIVQRLARFLTPSGRKAWHELTWLVLHKQPPHLGPADVQAGNVIVSHNDCTFIDMATIQFDWAERRLVAYSQKAHNPVGSLLTPEAYRVYEKQYGTEAMQRLALFDFIFWGIALARLHVLRTQPHSEAAHALQAAGLADDPALWQTTQAMWQRQRTTDDLIERIANSLTV